MTRRWGHGDFQRGNLLTVRRSLGTVLDWDAASPGSLPLLDLLHLIATTDRSLRRMPHGARCTRGLPRVVRSRYGAALGEYCDATGIPADTPTLETLVLAYWLTRVARDLRVFGERGSNEQWLELNVHRPLAELRER